MRRRTTTGIFRNYKGFFPYRMRTLWCNATGFDEGGRRFGFTLGESQTRDSNRDNENGFWLDGRLTLLPWVKITQTGDGMAEWVIQDTEGMVDLTFTPLEPLQASFNLILTKSHYFTPLGKFNGMLRAADGEKFRIANVWGTVEQLYLRV
jgi:hypothetical protein